MSLENIVIAVSLMLGIVLLILIIYLISRVNDLEARAFSNQTTASTEKKTENEPQKVFAGLSGRDLWDEWVSMANGGDDQYGIKGDRDRFLALLELHIRSLIKTGVEHGASGTNEPPSNPLKIKMLRGEFESYLPSSQAGRLYTLGRELGASEDSAQKASSSQLWLRQWTPSPWVLMRDLPSSTAQCAMSAYRPRRKPKKTYCH